MNETRTSKDTVKLLCKSLMTRMENKRMIDVKVSRRSELFDEVYRLVGPSILSDEDIQEKTFGQLNNHAEEVNDPQFGSREKYQAAKAVVRNSIGGEELNGLYFLKPIRELAKKVSGHVMASPIVEDVFESDEIIEKFVIETIRTFNPNQIS